LFVFLLELCGVQSSSYLFTRYTWKHLMQMHPTTSPILVTSLQECRCSRPVLTSRKYHVARFTLQCCSGPSEGAMCTSFVSLCVAVYPSAAGVRIDHYWNSPAEGMFYQEAREQPNSSQPRPIPQNECIHQLTMPANIHSSSCSKTRGCIGLISAFSPDYSLPQPEPSENVAK
jgi:hypothetical protein